MRVTAPPVQAATRTTAAIDETTRPLKAAAAFSIAAALAACGGGGGGGGSSGGFGFPISGSPNPGEQPDTGPYHCAQAQNDAEAARFLLQAQFSASDAEIAAVRAKGYMPWLSEQFSAVREPTAWEWVNGKTYGTVDTDAMIWQPAHGRSRPGAQAHGSGPQRNLRGLGHRDRVELATAAMMAQYWDTLASGVTGNFRQLLEDVSLNPAMGFYLNTRGNRKEDASGRTAVTRTTRVKSCSS